VREGGTYLGFILALKDFACECVTEGGFEGGRGVEVRLAPEGEGEEEKEEGGREGEGLSVKGGKEVVS